MYSDGLASICEVGSEECIDPLVDLEAPQHFSQTAILPPEEQVIIRSRVIDTPDGNQIHVTTRTTRRKQVRVIQNFTQRKVTIPLSSIDSECRGGGRGDNPAVGLLLQHIPQRRQSFLYRSDSDNESHNCETSQPDTGRSILGISSPEAVGGNFVTPFAQILACLKKVRINFMVITKATSQKDSRFGPANVNHDRPAVPGCHGDKEADKLAQETLQELEWCLEHLESVHTHRSVSDMASSKFKRLLNRELSHLSESSLSDHQISDYICRTFLDADFNDEAKETTLQLLQQKHDNNSSSKPTTGSAVAALTSASSISPTPSDVIACSTSPLSPIGISTPHQDELIELFNSSLDLWGMDMFKVFKLSNGFPLTAVTFTVFKRHNLMEKLALDPAVVVSYLLSLESQYRPDVPYHNSIHAADVTQSVHVLLSLPALEGVFTDLEVLAVIFACAIHDVNHPGVTNQYLINANDNLAVMYNDASVLENHHLAVAFSLMRDNGRNLFANLSRKQRQNLRRMVIDIVLSTDMSKHMSLLADLKTMVETKKVSGSGVLHMDQYSDRILILQNMVHCADLSNPTKPLPIYKQWIERIMKEFFLQGDLEKAANLDVSPMCDRNTASIEKTQVSFIDFIVCPLWESWSDLVHPDVQCIFETLQENRDYFFSFLKENDNK